jgi:hypothetical protein
MARRLAYFGSQGFAFPVVRLGVVAWCSSCSRFVSSIRNFPVPGGLARELLLTSIGGGHVGASDMFQPGSAISVRTISLSYAGRRQLPAGP